MAAHSSTLAWRISGTEEPGGLQRMGSRTTEATEHPSRHTSSVESYAAVAVDL